MTDDIDQENTEIERYNEDVERENADNGRKFLKGMAAIAVFCAPFVFVFGIFFNAETIVEGFFNNLEAFVIGVLVIVSLAWAIPLADMVWKKK